MITGTGSSGTTNAIRYPLSALSAGRNGFGREPEPFVRRTESMTRKLAATDVVIVGLGWTGSILAHELTGAGLSVVAIERGPWRDTATDFPPAYAQDELRYRI